MIRSLCARATQHVVPKPPCGARTLQALLAPAPLGLALAVATGCGSPCEQFEASADDPFLAEGPAVIKIFDDSSTVRLLHEVQGEHWYIPAAIINGIEVRGTGGTLCRRRARRFWWDPAWTDLDLPHAGSRSLLCRDLTCAPEVERIGTYWYFHFCQAGIFSRQGTCDFEAYHRTQDGEHWECLYEGDVWKRCGP